MTETLHLFLTKFRQILRGIVDQYFLEKECFRSSVYSDYPLTILWLSAILKLDFSKSPGKSGSARPPRGMKLGNGQSLFVWLSRDWPCVRTYASTDCTGGVGENIKRKGGVSQACLSKSTFFALDIHNMVNWQLSKQDSHWPVSHDHIAGSCVSSLRWRDLFGSYPLTS